MTDLLIIIYLTDIYGIKLFPSQAKQYTLHAENLSLYLLFWYDDGDTRSYVALCSRLSITNSEHFLMTK